MAIGPIANLASSYVLSLFTGNASNSNTVATTATSPGPSTSLDSNQLSPFAQLLGTLQQLQQTNPAQYQQVTQQIANNLQSGAQSATAAGNTNLASQLTQLSGDFRSASATGQLPNVQDLAHTVGGGHHHHHFGGSAANSASQLFQSSGSSQAGSQSALTIIDSTLSSTGITIS